MFSTLSVIHAVERSKDYKLSADKQHIYSTDPEKAHVDILVSDVLDDVRKREHCDFECLYSDPVSLDVTLRCKQCGAIIFTGDDERYDPNLKCPVCGGYDQCTAFWTAEEVAQDEKKQKTLIFYRQIKEFYLKDTERYNRTHLTAAELWKVTLRLGRKTKLQLSMICDNVFCSKVKGLAFKIKIFKQHVDHYTECKHIFTFPLSISAYRALHSIRKSRKSKYHSDDSHQK